MVNSFSQHLVSVYPDSHCQKLTDNLHQNIWFLSYLKFLKKIKFSEFA